MLHEKGVKTFVWCYEEMVKCYVKFETDDDEISPNPICITGLTANKPSYVAKRKRTLKRM